jgi:hypothetical protein
VIPVGQRAVAVTQSFHCTDDELLDRFRICFKRLSASVFSEEAGALAIRAFFGYRRNKMGLAKP